MISVSFYSSLLLQKEHSGLGLDWVYVKQFLIGPFWRHRFFQAILLDSVKAAVALAVAGTDKQWQDSALGSIKL